MPSAWKLLGGAIAIAFFGVLAVVAVPLQVNALAYLAGLERTDTFQPTSYANLCDGGNSCSTWTNGYLNSNGDGVTWLAHVPLNKPFKARAPVWAWGSGRFVISSRGYALVFLAIGFCADCWFLMIPGRSAIRFIRARGLQWWRLRGGGSGRL